MPIPQEELDSAMGGGPISLDEIDEALQVPSPGLFDQAQHYLGMPGQMLRGATGLPSPEGMEPELARTIGTEAIRGIPQLGPLAAPPLSLMGDESPLVGAVLESVGRLAYGAGTDPLTYAPLGALTKAGTVGKGALRALSGGFAALSAAGFKDAAGQLMKDAKVAMEKGELTPEVVQGLVNSAAQAGFTVLGGLGALPGPPHPGKLVGKPTKVNPRIAEVKRAQEAALSSPTLSPRKKAFLESIFEQQNQKLDAEPTPKDLALREQELLREESLEAMGGPREPFPLDDQGQAGPHQIGMVEAEAIRKMESIPEGPLPKPPTPSLTREPREAAFVEPGIEPGAESQVKAYSHKGPAEKNTIPPIEDIELQESTTPVPRDTGTGEGYLKPTPAARLELFDLPHGEFGMNLPGYEAAVQAIQQHPAAQTLSTIMGMLRNFTLMISGEKPITVGGFTPDVALHGAAYGIKGVPGRTIVYNPLTNFQVAEAIARRTGGSLADIAEAVVNGLLRTAAHEVAHVSDVGTSIKHGLVHDVMSLENSVLNPDMVTAYKDSLLNILGAENGNPTAQLLDLARTVWDMAPRGEGLVPRSGLGNAARQPSGLGRIVSQEAQGVRTTGAGTTPASPRGRGGPGVEGTARSAPTTHAFVKDLGKGWEHTITDKPSGSPEPPSLEYLHGGLGLVPGDWKAHLNKLAESPIGSVVNAWRTLASSYDLSAVGRQGKVAVIRHPGLLRDALGTSLQSLISEGKYDQAVRALKAHPAYKGASKAGLDLTDPNHPLKAEEAFMGKELVEWIPGVKGSERAYTAFLNKLRLDVYDAQLKRLNKWNRGHVPLETQKALAKWINVTTGRGSLGSLAGAARGLNTVLWSPKFLASRLQLLNPHTYYKLGKVDPRLLQIAVEDIGAFAAFNATLLYMFKQTGGSVETDPHSSDFMKARIERTRFDPWAGLQPIVRYAAQIVDETGKSTTSGKHYEVDPFKVLGQFAWTKTSPAVSAAIAAKLGRSVTGKPVDVMKGEGLGEILNPTPLTFRDIYEMWEEDPKLAIALAVPLALGESIQTYEKNPPRRPGRPKNQRNTLFK